MPKKKKPTIKVREHDFSGFAKFLEIAVDHINNAVAPPVVEIGIDPGTTGGIAFLCGDEAYAMDIPTQMVATKKMRTPTKKEKAEMRKTGRAIPKKITVHGKSPVFDYDAIWQIFKMLRDSIARKCIRVAVEKGQVRNTSRDAAKFAKNKFAKFGDTPLTAYKIGCAFGMWGLFLTSRGYGRTVPIMYPTPAAWKKALGLGTDKKDSISMAKKLFPGAAPLLARAKDHGKAEAILIAWYMRLNPAAAPELEEEE